MQILVLTRRILFQPIKEVTEIVIDYVANGSFAYVY